MIASPDLSSARRSRELAAAAEQDFDLVVIGGGITGAGVALDAASRGLSVALLEREDLAHGTSRFSSKLVHGGLRYLAQGQIGVAAESARERHHLMTAIAPHLIRPLATVIPFDGELSRGKRATLRVGYKLGDALRRSAGTSKNTLGRSHRTSKADAVKRVPGIKQQELDGALIGWDGRLEDDARLTVAVARTAAAHGARILTRCAVKSAERGRVRATDQLTGESIELTATNVINATGVWAGELDEHVNLKPSKGTHVIVPAGRLGNPTGSLTVPAHGGGANYVFAIPTAEQTVIIGLTDTEFDAPIPHEPHAEQWEIDLLLTTISSALEEPLTNDDVIGSYAGLRPLLAPEGNGKGKTADVSRRHQVLESADSGMLTLVGGKLTTYRQMAEDAVDRITELPCRTKTLPLVGALVSQYARDAAAADLAPPPRRLIRRFGAEADRVVALAQREPAALQLITETSEITAAELRFGAANELALTAGDLLDRRTRAGLTPALREQLLPAAQAALDWADQHTSSDSEEGFENGKF